jgi:hypothetical protein
MSGVALSVCVMPNITTPLTSAEVAQRVGDNIRTILAEQGHDLVWLAAEIGIDVQAIREGRMVADARVRDHPQRSRPAHPR